MILASGPMKIKAAMKDLSLHWAETDSKWKDKMRQKFEKDHFEPIEHQVTATLRALDRLSEMLNRAHQDCS